MVFYRAGQGLMSWGIIDWISFFVPCVAWLRTYQWRNWLAVGHGQSKCERCNVPSLMACGPWFMPALLSVQHDIVAGISVGFMVVPQGMAYASSAGLPSVFGLYGAFLPCLVYCCLGSSRQLAVGPVAVTSLLLAANLGSLIPCSQGITNPNSPGTPELVSCQAQYNHVAIQLTFIVACIYTSLGVLRMGWITKFLSHAVIGGFTTGAAITIGMGQVRVCAGGEGVTMPSAHSVILSAVNLTCCQGESHTCR